METLAINLSGNTRRETLHGREFLVAPLTLIVPGVLKGSQGSLLYPAEEIAKNVQAWNGMPLMVKHPVDSEGKPLSGRTPEANASQGIGTVFNAVIEDKKLTAEGWFDIQATRNLSPDILQAIEAKQPVELSTGLFTDNTKAPKGSEFGGVAYAFVARNYRPDHLAILPDQTGACSLEDGCGVLANTIKSKSETTTPFLSENKGGKAMDKKKKQELIDSLIENCEYCDEADKPTLNELSDDKLLAREVSMKKRLQEVEVVNAVQDFAGEDTPLEELASFVVNAKAKANADEEEEEDPKKKKELPAFLKKNKGKTKNQDGEEEEEEMADAKATKNQAMTEDEWLAAAPESVQNTHKYAQEIMTREKQELISRIVANVEDTKKKEVLANHLMTKDLPELRVFESLAPPVAEETNQASFAGAQGVTNQSSDGFDPNDILETPIINWNE